MKRRERIEEHSAHGSARRGAGSREQGEGTDRRRFAPHFGFFRVAPLPLRPTLPSLLQFSAFFLLPAPWPLLRRIFSLLSFFPLRVLPAP